MKTMFMLVLMLYGANDISVEQIGPFTEIRTCAEVAVRLTEMAKRNGIGADGYCVPVAAHKD